MVLCDKYENNGGGFTLERCPRDILGLLLIRNTGTRRSCRISRFSILRGAAKLEKNNNNNNNNNAYRLYDEPISIWKQSTRRRRCVTYSSEFGGKRNGREPAKRVERWSALTDGSPSPIVNGGDMTNAHLPPSVRRDVYDKIRFIVLRLYFTRA